MHGVHVLHSHAGRLSLSLVVLLALCWSPAPSAAAEAGGPMVFRFGKAGKANQQLVLTLQPAAGGRAVQVAVPNRENKPQYDPDPAIFAVIETLKPGDYVEIDIEAGKGPRPSAKSVKLYTPKPGEEAPGAYIFLNSYTHREGGKEFEAVFLSKLGQKITAAVPIVKNESGGSAPDEAMMKVLEAVKGGDLVEAELSGGRGVPTLKSLEPYKEPEAATFQGMAEEEGADGMKMAAVKLDIGGKTVTAVLPGAKQGKRWATDRKMLGAAKKLKAGADLLVRTREADGKVWVKRIEVQKKPRGGDDAGDGGGSVTSDPGDASKKK